MRCSYYPPDTKKTLISPAERKTRRRLTHLFADCRHVLAADADIADLENEGHEL